MNRLNSIKKVNAAVYAMSLYLACSLAHADHLPPDSIVLFSSGQTGSGIYERTAELAEMYSAQTNTEAHNHNHSHTLGLVTSAAGSSSNLKNLISSHFDFGVVRADVAEAIYRSPRAFNFDLKIDHARVVGHLAPSVVQLVARKSGFIKRTLSSLAGKQVGIGLPDDQVELTVRGLFASHGLAWESIAPFRGPLEDTLRLLRLGHLDSLVWIDQLPSPQVDGLLEDGEFELISLDPELLQNYLDKHSNANVYQSRIVDVEGHNDPVLMLTVDTLLMARDTVSPRAIEPLAHFFREQFQEASEAERAALLNSTIPLHEAVSQFVIHNGKTAANQLDQ